MAPAAGAVGSEFPISPEDIAFGGPRSYISESGSIRAIMTTIDEIRDNFELLEEWDDRYRYVIELGRTLEPMPEAEHSAGNKVQGCVSQVWLSKTARAQRQAARS